MLAWLSASGSCTAGSFTNKYDDDIRNAVKHYWVDFPVWKLLKAQLFQESRLDPDAISPVGARGLGQFMAPTWDDITKQIGLGSVDRRDAKSSIVAAAFYMSQLRHTWRSPRPDMDRHHLAEASYNAGTGSIIKAQQRCGGPALYDEIVACLPEITGPKFSRETLTYVQRIDQWWKELEAVR